MPKHAGTPVLESSRLKHHFENETERTVMTQAMFDRSADLYDRIEWWTGLGSGPRYRRHVLQQAGLRSGMQVLDVATGTGLVAREALALIGPSGRLIGLDPSPGMLNQARRKLEIEIVQGYAEAIPLPSEQFDFLTMGYALRHVADLETTFREYFRVLKPGGKICILEIVRPNNRLLHNLLKFHLHDFVPAVTRLLLRRPDVSDLWKYYWDTIEVCVPNETIEAAISAAGFVSVRSQLSLGMFREYLATKP